MSGPADGLNRRYAHQAWANRETLRSLEAVPSPPDRALAIMAHIPAVERIWLGRLGFPSPPALTLPIWPTIPLGEVRHHLTLLADAWPDILARVVADGLDCPVTFTSLAGEAYTALAGDILETLPLHSAYHRGQVATLLGQAGHSPSQTDFIRWAILGSPQPGTG